MTSSRSAIFCLYLLVIYKKTGLKGLLPQCYIKITKFCFKQHDFFHIFLPLLKISFWPCVTSKNLRFFLPNLHTLYDFKWSFQYTFKKYIFLDFVVNFLPEVTFKCFQLTSSELSFITISCKFKGI